MDGVNISQSLEDRFDLLAKELACAQQDLDESLTCEGEAYDCNTRLRFLLGDTKLLFRRALRIIDRTSINPDDKFVEDVHALIAQIGSTPQDPLPERSGEEIAALQAESRLWRRGNLMELRAVAVKLGQPVDGIDRELAELVAKSSEAALAV